MMKPAIFIFFVVALSAMLFSFQQNDALKASIARGQEVYTSNCVTCHMQKGEGIQSVYPPLAKSDYLMADKKRAVRQILEGASESMTVNGVEYNGFMNGFSSLSDKEVSDVLNYIRNSWGNKGEIVKPEEIKSARP